MQIKILQWNIWYKENPQKIAKEVKKINPDIFCGQEFTQVFEEKRKIDRAKIVAGILGFNYTYIQGQSWGNENNGKNIGNAIFSKYPIIIDEHLYIQEPTHDPIDFSKEGRVYIEVLINVNKKLITAGTTHLSYSDRFIETESRLQESSNLVNAISSKKENYVFTGDLNAIPNSYVVKELEKYLQNAGPDQNKNTWTTKPFDYLGFKVNSLDYRLDYVFTTKDIKVVSSEILETELSDHLPILITIEI